MLPNPTLRKLVQISEESLPPVHVPLILGNEFYILTQQDVRQIEDTRRFTISKLMPNGVLKTINSPDASDWLQQYSKQENLLVNQQQAMLQILQQASPTYCCDNPSPQPMEVSMTACNNHNIASIEQQLQWNKSERTSKLFPMTYSRGTSTTEINCKQPDIKDNRNISSCLCCKICQQKEKLNGLCNKTTNTELQIDSNKKSCSCNKTTNTELQIDSNNETNEVLNAREQLKKRKIRFSLT